MAKTKGKQIIEATIKAQVAQSYYECQKWINETLRLMAKDTKLEQDVNWALEICNNFSNLKNKH
ncbi:hypothetical protein R6231_14500 [Bacillus cytotoxicus]|uniref:hypothetical protein n=1 Tax=Bacillus cereus group TaxID=86661 RepID=UPI000B9765CE|nr:MULTISPECIES: hypothetical protein [Bacillus cereus group]AWC31008.1 hypothetical protein CG483_022580 [Bacillus cytotoxicus]AWC35044.1 hypothetical protein CG482_022565 [Bacillus cytotoxicus]AWC39083.1 hypothetical protein CG481_022570 [Bacillus cytotoxicus]AWC43100.1 hypothetical protein CG480_022415 [Bacillus cytotoxicus]AWC46987.1 hypothetical protein CG479_021535 [Bacillus cytotoxicus]